MNIEEALSLTLGTVTPSGLVVGEALFTSPTMIKQKWFELADHAGSWNVPVIVHASNLDEVHLMEFKIMDRAFRVGLSSTAMAQHEINDYHLRLRELKQQIREKH